MKILVAIDLVHPIQSTLELLKSTVDLKHADVKLLYVRELLPAYENVIHAQGSFSTDWDQQMDSKAHSLFDEAQIHLNGAVKSFETEITSGSPASMIETVAHDEGYDMIVVTPGKHNPAERLFAGSVTARVVNHAKGIVFIAKPQPETLKDGLTNVLIGFDGSTNARLAIEKALTLFDLTNKNVKVTVAHSVDLVDPVKFLMPLEFVSALEQNLLMQGETFLADAEKLLKGAGVSNIQSCLVEGNPAGELIKLAKDSKADLIIIGAQGHSAVEHFLVGSVSQKVATNAPCSVAVVKVPKEKSKK